MRPRPKTRDEACVDQPQTSSCTSPGVRPRRPPGGQLPECGTPQLSRERPQAIAMRARGEPRRARASPTPGHQAGPSALALSSPVAFYASTLPQEATVEPTNGPG